VTGSLFGVGDPGLSQTDVSSFRYGEDGHDVKSVEVRKKERESKMISVIAMFTASGLGLEKENKKKRCRTKGERRGERI
jgi:hypothetical protein